MGNGFLRKTCKRGTTATEVQYRTWGELYTAVAELMMEQDFMPDSRTQAVERFFSDTHRDSPREVQQRAMVALLQTTGFNKAQLGAFRMDEKNRGDLATAYRVLGWASFVLFAGLVLIASLNVLAAS